MRRFLQFLALLLLCGGANAAWTNPYATGLQIQLMAESASGNDGDPVSTYPDVSGNSNNATASGSARATLKRAIVNSRDGLLFNGSSNIYTLGSTLSVSGDYTLFAVQQRGASGNCFGFQNSSNGTTYSPFDLGSQVYISSPTAGFIVNYASVPVQPMVVWSVVCSSGVVRLYANGVLQTAASTFGSSGPTTLDSIGSRASVPDYSSGIRFADIKYSAALSDANRILVEQSLMSYFGAGLSAVYIAQTAAGSDTGASAPNAHSVAWLNDASYWGQLISAGCIVHLTGTISTAITVQGNGTSGHPIKLLFDSGSKLSTTVWTLAGAISVPRDYITIDGGTNGILECTDNGTLLGHKANCIGILGTGASHFTVQNLTLRNLYVRTSTTDGAIDQVWGIANLGTVVNVTGFTVSNCTINNCVAGIVGEYGQGASTYVFSGNTIETVNHGIDVPDRDLNATLDSVEIYGNTIRYFTPWDDTAGNAFHHNAIYTWSVQGGPSKLTSVSVHGNTFGPGLGGIYQTSLYYVQGAVQDVLIYNNLFLASAGESSANGMITLGQSIAGTAKVLNNTFQAGGTGSVVTLGLSSGQAYTLTNNLGLGGGGGTFLGIYNSGDGGTLSADYNAGSGFDAAAAYGYSTNASIVGKSFAQWQGLGFDAHGSSATPTLVAYVPAAADTVARHAGSDLSSIFTTDLNGATRTVPWDTGALKAAMAVASGHSGRSALSGLSGINR